MSTVINKSNCVSQPSDSSTDEWSNYPSWIEERKAYVVRREVQCYMENRGGQWIKHIVPVVYQEVHHYYIQHDYVVDYRVAHIEKCYDHRQGPKRLF